MGKETALWLFFSFAQILNSLKVLQRDEVCHNYMLKISLFIKGVQLCEGVTYVSSLSAVVVFEIYVERIRETLDFLLFHDMRLCRRNLFRYIMWVMVTLFTSSRTLRKHW